MNISIKYLIIISIFMATFSGCKKGGGTPEPAISDTTKPAISVTKPIAGQVFVAGNTITFQATFSDNEKLKSYEISISKVATGGFILKNVPASVSFSYIRSSTSFSSGVKQEVISLSDIIIPANTATTIVTPGKYNFNVTCLDGSTNSTQTTIEININ